MEQDWILTQGGMQVESAAEAEMDSRTATRMNTYHKKLGNQTLISPNASSSQRENARGQIPGTNRNGSGNRTAPYSEPDGSQHGTREHYEAARQGREG